MLPSPNIPALCRFNSTVVIPNAIRPNGAGLDNLFSIGFHLVGVIDLRYIRFTTSTQKKHSFDKNIYKEIGYTFNIHGLKNYTSQTGQEF